MAEQFDASMLDVVFALGEVTSHSYSSNYFVKAAALLEDGKVFAGANIEYLRFSSKPTVALHAEESLHSALYTSLSLNSRPLVQAIYIVGRNFPKPCGHCRDILKSYNASARILIAESEFDLLPASNCKVEELELQDLLPMSFQKFNFQNALKHSIMKQRLEHLELLLRRRSFTPFSSEPQAAMIVSNKGRELTGILRETCGFHPIGGLNHVISQAFEKLDFKNGEFIEDVYLAGNGMPPSFAERQDLFELQQLQQIVQERRLGMKPREINVLMLPGVLSEQQTVLHATVTELLPFPFGSGCLINQ